MTQKQINKFHLFISYFFISKGSFRDAAFYPGIDLQATTVQDLFGSSYKAQIITPLIDHGILRLVSDSYKIGEFTKKYALKPAAVNFFAELSKKVERKPNKRLNKHLQEIFDKSITVNQYSIADARIHSSWCSVPSQQRHTFTQIDGKKLLLDIDLECAYPSMLAELHRDKGFDMMFLGDFYNNVIREAGLNLDRDEAKKLFLVYLNSPAEKRSEFKGELTKLEKYFSNNFPLIASFIAEKNKLGEYLGGYLARQYEAPVIFDLQNLIKSDPILAPLSSVIIYDGIEIWGEALTSLQRQRITELCSTALSCYKYLRVKNKEVNPLAI